MNPQSELYEAESQLVGVALHDVSVLDRCHRITPMHFADRQCGLIWRVMTRLRDAGCAANDPSTIHSESKRQNVFREFGGAAKLAMLHDAAGVSSLAEQHARVIEHEFEKRRLLAVLRDATEVLESNNTDLASVRGMIEAMLYNGSATDHDAASIHSVMVKTIGELGGDDVGGVPTGLPTFDTGAGGMHAGQLLIVAARPSVGKSALAAGMALAAASDGKRVAFISLEMQRNELALRWLAGQTGQSIRRLRDGLIDETTLSRAAEAYRELPLLLWSGRNATTDKIRGICRLEQARGGLDAVFIDYIGLIRPSDPRKPRWEQMTETSNTLKTMALSLGIPVVALCQLNRDAEGERPKLSHLRESGAIEQDADVVMLLDRPRETTASADATKATLHIDKIRSGRTGPIELDFDGAAFRFSEPPIDSHDNFNNEFAEYGSAKAGG